MEEKTVLINDLKINFKVAGQGPAILVLHGWVVLLLPGPRFKKLYPLKVIKQFVLIFQDLEKVILLWNLGMCQIIWSGYLILLDLKIWMNFFC